MADAPREQPLQDDFEDEVVRALAQLEAIKPMNPPPNAREAWTRFVDFWALRALGASSPGFREDRRMLLERRLASENVAQQLEELTPERARERAHELGGRAWSLVGEPDVLTRRYLKYLCPALEAAAGDAPAIARAMTPVFVSSSSAGTLSIPEVPLLYAMCALIVARHGATGLCAGYDRQDARAEAGALLEGLLGGEPEA